MRLLYAVTAHGLGHWTRSAALIDALLAIDRDLEIVVSTGLTQETVAGAFGSRVMYRHGDYEPGAIQHNCLDVDAQATALAYLRYASSRSARLASERAFLSRQRFDLVLSDVSALPVRAAADLGIPALAVANFTWDWLLEPMLAGTEAAHLPAQLAEDYRAGEGHWLLPFGQRQSPFSQVREAPIVARRARHTPSQTRTLLGLTASDGRPLLLVCIGGWGGQGLPPIRVTGAAHVLALIVGDIDIESEGPSLRLPHKLPGELVFPDLVQLADAVITKPGYGMASECAVHGTPVAFVERSCFRESPAILAAMVGRHPTYAMAREEFEGGRWGAALDSMLAAPASVPLPEGSAELAKAILSGDSNLGQN